MDNENFHHFLNCLDHSNRGIQKSSVYEIMRTLSYMTALFVLKRKGAFMKCLDFISSVSSIYPVPEVGVRLAQSLPSLSRGEEVPTALLFIENSIFDTAASSNTC